MVWVGNLGNACLLLVLLLSHTLLGARELKAEAPNTTLPGYPKGGKRGRYAAPTKDSLGRQRPTKSLRTNGVKDQLQNFFPLVSIARSERLSTAKSQPRGFQDWDLICQPVSDRYRER